jgi:RNA polymerase sigma-70 factor (ECF subfamily)
MSRLADDCFVRTLIGEQQQVYRYIASLVPNTADAEELFQQTLLTAWERRAQFDADRGFVLWACGIAWNHVRNFRRRAQNHQVLLSDDVLEQLAQLRIEESGLLDDRREVLHECVEELPDQSRTLLQRFYGKHKTVEELAADANRTPNAIYKMVQRIRGILLDCVSRKLSWEGQP